MSDESSMSFKVTVGDQSFRIRIQPAEKAYYERISRFTESTYQEVAKQAVEGGPRVWAMTAFQIASELYHQHSGEDINWSEEQRERIDRLIQRIEDATSSP